MSPGCYLGYLLQTSRILMELILKNGLPLLQFSHLARYERMVHAVTTRQGGVSEGPFASLNLGINIGDDFERVYLNRKKVLSALGWESALMVTSVQVHGNEVVVVDKALTTREASGREKTLCGVDGLITKEKGILLTIKVADCFPVFLYDPERHAIGLLHAGWRGTAQSIIRRGLKGMADAYGTEPKNLQAGIGPGIGQCCYHVGREVREAFGHDSALDTCFSESCQRTSSQFDLRKAICQELVGCGVKKEKISIATECTSCSQELFFSHRRDKGRTGRMMAVIGLRD